MDNSGVLENWTSFRGRLSVPRVAEKVEKSLEERQEEARLGLLERTKGLGYENSIDEVVQLSGLSKREAESRIARQLVGVHDKVMKDNPLQGLITSSGGVLWSEYTMEVGAVLNRVCGEMEGEEGVSLESAFETAMKKQARVEKAASTRQLHESAVYKLGEGKISYIQYLNERFPKPADKMMMVLRTFGALIAVGGMVSLAGDTLSHTSSGHDQGYFVKHGIDRHKGLESQVVHHQTGEYRVDNEGEEIPKVTIGSETEGKGHVTSDFQVNELGRIRDGQVEVSTFRIGEFFKNLLNGKDAPGIHPDALYKTLSNPFNPNFGSIVDGFNKGVGAGLTSESAGHVINDHRLENLGQGESPFVPTAEGRQAVTVETKFEDLPQTVANLLKHTPAYEHATDQQLLDAANHKLQQLGIQESGDSRDGKLSGTVHTGVGYIGGDNHEHVLGAVFDNNVEEGKETVGHQRLDTKTVVIGVVDKNGELAIGVNTLNVTPDLRDSAVDKVLDWFKKMFHVGGNASPVQVDLLPIRPPGFAEPAPVVGDTSGAGVLPEQPPGIVTPPEVTSESGKNNSGFGNQQHRGDPVNSSDETNNPAYLKKEEGVDFSSLSNDAKKEALKGTDPNEKIGNTKP